MSVPESHLQYLRRKSYRPERPADFSSDELDLLSRYGHWLEALASGAIEPTTPVQERFLLVVQGKAAPETPFERVWDKLVCSRELSGSAEEDGDEVAGTLQQLTLARLMLAELRQELEAERDEILASVRDRLAAVDARYAPQLEEASREVADLEQEARKQVLQLGRTVKVPGLHAVFSHGRVSWDPKGLEQYAQSHPEVRKFRTVGEPWVSLHFKKEEEEETPEKSTPGLPEKRG